MGYTMPIPDEMRKKYIERRRRDVEELSVASSSKDLAPFIKVGHQLKGNGITFGYQELADLGVRMEEAGLQENWNEVNACLAALKVWAEAKS